MKADNTVVLAGPPAHGRTGALALAIAGCERLTLVARPATAREVLALCRTRAPAVAIIETARSGIDALAVLESLQAESCVTRVVVLVPVEDGLRVDSLVSHGAAACVCSDADPERVIAAAVAVVEGAQLVFSRELWPGVRRDSPIDSQGEVRLSPRELEVLEMSSRGNRSKQIAARLGIGCETVETTLRRATEKLQATTRTHAVAEAMRRGIL
jgi:DNA-binding NarL/FixJ family response regulator